MKFNKFILMVTAMFALPFAAQAASDCNGYSSTNCQKHGGGEWVVGGTAAVASGGSLDVESGASLKLAGTALTPSAAEINNLKVSTRNVSLAVSTSITEATHEGKKLMLGGAGSARTMTLPAATGGGAIYKFVVGAVNTSNYIITRTGNDVIKGVLVGSTDNASDGVNAYETQTATTITLNGTTTGGAGIGDFITLHDCLADTWCADGHITGSGTEATPFS